MGEARKRRLALIKDGKAEEAKQPAHNPSPQDLVVLSCIATKRLEGEVLKRYELVNPETVPTLSAFIERLILAGIASFDRAQAEQEAAGSLVQIAPPGAVPKGMTPEKMAEVSRRLQALKDGAQ